MARILEPVLGVSRVIARHGWYGGGNWREGMVELGFLWIARIVPPEQRLAWLS